MKREITTEDSQKIENRMKALTRAIEAYPTPVLVRYPDKRVRFTNFAFRDLFFIVDEIEENFLDINEKILPYESQNHTVDSFSEEDSRNNLFSMKTDQGKKVFRVNVDRITLSQDDEEIIFTFNDITIEEYRKQKIKNYSGRLEDYIIKYRKEREKYIENFRSIINQEEIIEKSVVRMSRALAEDEEKILRKSYQEKITAEIYCKEIDNYILEELAELSEIENELKDLIFEFEEKIREKELRVIGEKFLKYASTVSLLFEFEDLSVAIKGVSEFINRIIVDDLDEKKLKKLALITASIADDLISWRENIFILKTAKDIHYLDSSLFSSCLQLEIGILDEEIEDNSGDLDLF